MQNLRFRCPHCHRLYEADSSDIKIHNPQFECISCHTRFGFFYPPADVANVSCFIVPDSASIKTSFSNQNNSSSKLGDTSAGSVFAEQNGISDFRETLKKQLGASLRKTDENCPKCGSTKFEAATECYSCGVIFSKLEGLPTDPNLKAQPSLVRKWKEVLLDYDNQEKHDYFVESCMQLQALPFAVFKYEEIKKLQGQDAKAEMMLQKITALGMVKLQQSSEMKFSVAETGVSELSNQNVEEAADLNLEKILAVTPEPLHGLILRIFVWREKLRPLIPYLPYAPYMVSAILILWGLLSIGHRNTIGLGVAIAILVFGWRNWLGGKNYSS